MKSKNNEFYSAFTDDEGEKSLHLKDVSSLSDEELIREVKRLFERNNKIVRDDIDTELLDFLHDIYDFFSQCYEEEKDVIEDVSLEFLEEWNHEEPIPVYVFLICDISSSMEKYSRSMYDTFSSICNDLVKIQNEDWIYKVKLIFFSDQVKEFNNEFISPELLISLVSEKDFICNGSVFFSKAIDYLDNQFTEEMLKKRYYRRGCKSFVVLFTNYSPNEAEDVRKSAINKIVSNQLYKKVNSSLCVLFGNDKNKAEIAEFVGSLDNIITPDFFDVSGLLTPLIIF